MSSLIKLEWQDSSTALLQMQDTASKNTLSADLILALQNAIQEINNNTKAKCVILIGLESEFCCGHAKLNYQPASNQLCNLLLDCQLPVIAAMQGDALGDGLILAAYADIMVMAEEANYSSYYLNESFSPGIEATYIIPKKFGPLLGAEFLYSAQPYPGHVLKARNTPIRIIKKEKVLSTAMELAKDLSEKLETSLRLLKKNITDVIRSELLPYQTQDKIVQ